MLKTLIVSTCKNRLAEAVLTTTHNLCFGSKIRKIGIPLHNRVLLYKSGFKGVYIAQTYFPDEQIQIISNSIIVCRLFFRQNMSYENEIKIQHIIRNAFCK